MQSPAERYKSELEARDTAMSILFELAIDVSTARETRVNAAGKIWPTRRPTSSSRPIRKANRPQ